jgi:glutamate mutase epsilon subunit
VFSLSSLSLRSKLSILAVVSDGAYDISLRLLFEAGSNPLLIRSNTSDSRLMTLLYIFLYLSSKLLIESGFASLEGLKVSYSLSILSFALSCSIVH